MNKRPLQPGDQVMIYRLPSGIERPSSECDIITAALGKTTVLSHYVEETDEHYGNWMFRKDIPLKWICSGCHQEHSGLLDGAPAEILMRIDPDETTKDEETTKDKELEYV